MELADKKIKTNIMMKDIANNQKEFQVMKSTVSEIKTTTTITTILQIRHCRVKD